MIEVSGIFHDISLLVGYLAGIGIAIATGRKNSIDPSISALLILICTIAYIFFSEFVFIHVDTWLYPYGSGIKHIDRTAGIAGAIAGLFLSGVLLNIPRRVLYSYSIPLLVIIAISNLGCMAGHCSAIPGNGMSLQALSGVISGGLPVGFSLSFRLSPVDIFRISLGILAAVCMISFRKKIKNPRNLALWVFSLLLWISFINLFSTPSGILFNRMMGLNVFQWAIILFNVILTLFLIADETANHKKYPKLRITSPPNYRIFSVYIFIFFMAFPDSTFLLKTNLQIFIIGFSTTTLFLVYYFHSRLKPTVFRYATVVVLLSVGSVFLQASVFAPQDPVSGTAQQDKINNPELIDRGILSPHRLQPADSGGFQVVGKTGNVPNDFPEGPSH